MITTDTAMTTANTDTAQFWAAPANIERINSGASSWGIEVRSAGDLIALPLAHYSYATLSRQPGGRTPGRALRACRRWLRANPVRMDGHWRLVNAPANRDERRALARYEAASAVGESVLGRAAAVGATRQVTRIVVLG